MDRHRRMPLASILTAMRLDRPSIPVRWRIPLIFLHGFTCFMAGFIVQPIERFIMRKIAELET